MRDLTIITDEGSKGRSFRATLLAYARARYLWEGGEHENLRPTWAMIAMGDAESLPFVRNLQCGRKATISGDKVSYKDPTTLECLKSAGYEYHCQRHVTGWDGDKPVTGAVWTLFLPDLYRIDTGMQDPEFVKFAVLPSAEWIGEADEPTAKRLADKYRKDTRWHAEAQREQDAKTLADTRHVTRIAPLFCAYLDRRTRCPLIPDPVFYSMVLAAMLNVHQVSFNNSSRDDWGHGGTNYEEIGLDDVGLLPGVACHTTHANLEPLLAEVVKEYESLSRVVSVPLKQAA